ncbi:MAG: TIGR03546 family protein [Arcobacteraceae bacterium]
MFTIKKIWDALNHAGKPWQIALALAFGMVVGFTPLLSIHNALILFVVLCLNIHIGVFLLATSLFSILGFALDPLFGSIGTAILTNESLQTTFTQWYNIPFGNLSGFNNTILMGSLVVSLVLFIFVYKFSSFVLIKYRTVIATKIKNIPLLNKLQFFTGEDIKAVKSFRVVGIAIIVFLIAALSLFKIVIFDEIVKSNLEKAINESSNKIVKIGSLSTSILNSSIVFENIYISDKKDKSNNLNIKNITIDINISQLVFKKVLLENVIIDKISFPNEVQINSKISSTSTSKQKSQENSSVGDLTSLKNINVDDIKKGFDQDFKAEFDKYKDYYNEIKPLFNSEKKVEQKRADGKFISFDLDSNIPDLLIKQGKFSIFKNETVINGKFEDFTTNQNLYKKPFKITIDTKTPKKGTVLADISLLETSVKSVDNFTVQLKEFPLSDMSKKGISINNTQINTFFELTITNKTKLVGVQDIDVLSTDIVFSESNKYITMLNKSLIATKGIKGSVKISGDINKPELKIDSNIDTILRNKVKAVLSSQKENLKKELKQKVESKIKEKVNSKLKGILGF